MSVTFQPTRLAITLSGVLALHGEATVVDHSRVQFSYDGKRYAVEGHAQENDTEAMIAFTLIGLAPDGDDLYEVPTAATSQVFLPGVRARVNYSDPATAIRSALISQKVAS